jgi:hypothetical protein
MTGRRGRITALSAAALAAATAVAGCGAAASTSASSSPASSSAAALSAMTSVVTADGGWAVVPMGGTGPNLFWQLFSLSGAGGQGGQWVLNTPPDVATNGAIILAPRDGQGSDAGTLLVGIRPSIDLSFSPFLQASDQGKTWTSLPPGAGLANVADSLAASADGQLLALGADGKVSDLSPSATGWSSLTSEKSLAAMPADGACGLVSLTAVAYTAAGAPLAGGACAKAGVAGIFAYSGGAWHLTGPSPAGPLAGQRIRVLRLTRTGSTDAALLEAGSGSSAVLAAAWTADGGARWTVSPALPLRGAQPQSASFGAAGAVGVTLSGNRADVIEGPGASWQALPALPAGRSVTLAMPAAGTVEALAAGGGTLTVSRTAPGGSRWSTAQVVKVPIQYGSSD